jgi:hypothetical protein
MSKLLAENFLNHNIIFLCGRKKNGFSKRYLPFKLVTGRFISQKLELSMITALRTSHPIYIVYRSRHHAKYLEMSSCIPPSQQKSSHSFNFNQQQINSMDQIPS